MVEAHLGDGDQVEERAPSVDHHADKLSEQDDRKQREKDEGQRLWNKEKQNA